MHIKEFNYRKGREGEEEARIFLENKGYELIEANFEIDIGEIDLIMSKDGWLVFVEVKYKSDDYMGLPEEMITPRKLAQVKRVAEIYLMKNPKMRRTFVKYRVDAVCILGSSLKHYENLE
ncbi:MAG: YraN family protein [Candidatus Shapirobacteria bacterium]|nr:YraN family protein [Candidatus Shapirobacteria bacterium]